jgi:SAM-dependent methyltransferase
MNQEHLDVLSSPRWTEMLKSDMLPWLEATAELGDDLLEIGPGPGLTTDLLRLRVARMTAVEIDPTLAAPLSKRMAGTNVTVLEADASHLDFDDDSFSAVACFAVLHHVPSFDVQQAIFSEIFRVLRPGAALVASDGYDNAGTRAHHAGDLFVPLDPDALNERLGAFGFVDVTLDRGEYDFRFAAWKPERAAS